MKYSSLSAHLFELERKIEQRSIRAPEALQHLVRHLADDRRARIEVLVDTMAKPHQTEGIILIFSLGDVLLNVARIANLFEHVQHRLVGAAVRRPPQGRHACRNR